jgi:hypothetical protein
MSGMIRFSGLALSTIALLSATQNNSESRVGWIARSEMSWLATFAQNSSDSPMIASRPSSLTGPLASNGISKSASVAQSGRRALLW